MPRSCMTLTYLYVHTNMWIFISYLQRHSHNHEHASQHMCQLQNLGSGPSGGHWSAVSKEVGHGINTIDRHRKGIIRIRITDKDSSRNDETNIDHHWSTCPDTHTHTHVVICSILPFFKRTILQTSYVMNTNRFCAIPLKDTRARKLYLVMRLSKGVVLR